MRRKNKILRIGVVFVCVGLLFSGIAIVKEIMNQQVNSFEDEMVVKIEENTQEAEEVLKSPVNKEIGIVRYYYNQEDDIAKKEQSLILFEGVYRPHKGIDYASNDIFDVYASISGEVTNITTDPLLGKIVTITNKNNISITYQSLSEVNVELNKTVKQGDIIGKSGVNEYESDLGNHMHFILEKEGVLYNPETYIDKPLNTIK